MAKWTATNWDRCKSVREMLDNSPSLSRRKLRLFAVTLCKRFTEFVTNPHSLAALAAAERDAEKPFDGKKRQALRVAADAAVREFWSRFRADALYSANRRLQRRAAEACAAAILASPLSAARSVSVSIQEAAILRSAIAAGVNEVHEAVLETERSLQADLLRHIVGNPFRPVPRQLRLPAAVVRLAAALEAGEPVAFALRDALLEAGQIELAEHFAGDEPHPRGCWVLDVIGGRA